MKFTLNLCTLVNVYTTQIIISDILNQKFFLIISASFMQNIMTTDTYLSFSCHNVLHFNVTAKILGHHKYISLCWLIFFNHCSLNTFILYTIFYVLLSYYIIIFLSFSCVMLTNFYKVEYNIPDKKSSTWKSYLKGLRVRILTELQHF